MEVEQDTPWLKLFKTFNESQRRRAAAVKAIEFGYGGISKVSQITGLSRVTISQGIKEVKAGKYESDVIRSYGGGRKSICAANENIKEEIEKIIGETTAGDPMSRLQWTSKSMRKIAEELQSKKHSISFNTVNRILHDMEYSLQSNRKTLSRGTHPERDCQFQNINAICKTFLKLGAPVISVDAKKRELVGKFKNNGKTWRKKGNPEKAEDHDFRSRAKGVAIPYGAFDINRNEGFVNIGITFDTAEFAVNSIRQWWDHFGKTHYSKATKILICADGGGSNSSVNRLWKLSLQKFSNETGLSVWVRHYPPGTSKWNKIEHRMFSYISLNWKGRLLKDYSTIVQLISNTTTKKGLKIKATVDKRAYIKGQKVLDKDFKTINIKFGKEHPKWNYTISPI